MITDSRLIGSIRAAIEDGTGMFFEPGAGRDPAVEQEAQRRAAEIVLKKDFELQRDKILKIIYYEPGMLFGGRLQFSTVGRKVDVGITVISGWNPGILTTLRTLVSSLLVFSPERFYDERTGARIRDEAASRWLTSSSPSQATSG